MDPKNVAIAALAVGLAIQTSRARFYRKDAERLSENYKRDMKKAVPLLLRYRDRLVNEEFEQMIKDF